MKKSFNTNPLTGSLADIARSVASGGADNRVPSDSGSGGSHYEKAHVQNGKTTSVRRNGRGNVEKEIKPASAVAGCRPGYSRHTYILPIVVIEQIRNIASYCNQSESSTVEELLMKGINDAIAKNGKQIVREVRKKSLFG